MAFQPFGYRFEIESPLPPSKVKAQIRARKKRWLDPKEGPRGWIAGPFICMWMSALRQHGPMLLGRISQHGFGTRISGRAGSDLNGGLAFAALTPVMGWAVYKMVTAGQATVGYLAIIFLIFGVGLPLTLWIHHMDRRHADPLVRFVRQTITPPGQSLRVRAASAVIAPQIRITVSGEEKSDAVTAESIHDALLHAGVGDSVVLAIGTEDYMQTLLQEDGFILEKREGHQSRHSRAVRRDRANDRTLFTFEETLIALIAYASGSPVSDLVTWEPMELPE